MNLLTFAIVALIVGFVTAGLKIQFDRFFAIILLVILLKFSVIDAVNTFLWIIFLSAAYALWKNRQKIKRIPAENKKKFLTLVPTLAFVGALTGTFIFAHVANQSLEVTLGILALLYGLRLIFIHFKSSEFEYKNAKPIYLKICGLFGPIVSGFFVGFIGTALKPLKIPFAVKIGKMNMGQVYLGNTITAMYASLFAIILHSFYLKNSAMTAIDVFAGISLWITIHIVFEITNLFFKDQWRKAFQIAVGIILILVSFRFL